MTNAIRPGNTTAQQSDNARAVIERWFQLLYAEDSEAMMDLVTDDAALYQPWQLPGLPDRAIGRPALYRIFGGTARDMWAPGAMTAITVRQLVEPDSWLVEAEGDLTCRATGRPYHATYVAVFRMRDGKIAEMKQYHNSLNQVIALGADIHGVNV
ncbi:nuclear transport factor 2 family protein [Nocardia altamirensis]|uniref:nuclear transport factor 2 family protein n=1 Tax=Nocardia altamirensis TaxID=472158 RepID=UPI00114CD6FA|nr:nuclear transport factor 2 family protein [Nocardia altamirensis]